MTAHVKRHKEESLQGTMYSVAIQHIIGCGFEMFMAHPALHQSNPMHLTGKNTPDI